MQAPDPWPPEWEEARKQVNDLVNSEHGDVCNFLIVALIHMPDGRHGMQVVGPMLDTPHTAAEILAKAAAII